MRSEISCQGFCEGICLHHHQCNCRMQQLQLLRLMGKRGGRPEGACCDVLCAAPAIAIYPSPTFAVNRNFSQEVTGEKQRRHSEILAIVSFFSCFVLSVYCRLLTVSVCFVCLKSGPDYIVMSSKSNQNVRHNLCTTKYTWWLPCDQST